MSAVGVWSKVRLDQTIGNGSKIIHWKERNAWQYTVWLRRRKKKEKKKRKKDKKKTRTISRFEWFCHSFTQTKAEKENISHVLKWFCNPITHGRKWWWRWGGGDGVGRKPYKYNVIYTHNHIYDLMCLYFMLMVTDVHMHTQSTSTHHTPQCFWTVHHMCHLCHAAQTPDDPPL